jgi:hypothetical protein
MLRMIAGIVVGYLVMVALVFISFSAAYLIMGADGAFNPGSYEPSSAWLITSFILSVLAAIAGGFICVLLAGNARSAWILSGLVLVLGLLMAVGVVMAEKAPLENRTGDVGNLEAMMKARQPDWVALANPFLGAAGVLFGSRFRRSAWESSNES